MGFFDFMTEDIAIDLGTANTLIIHNGKVVIDSPSIVARNRVSGKIKMFDTFHFSKCFRQFAGVTIVERDRGAFG